MDNIKIIIAEDPNAQPEQFQVTVTIPTPPSVTTLFQASVPELDKEILGTDQQLYGVLAQQFAKITLRNAIAAQFSAKGMTLPSRPLTTFEQILAELEDPATDDATKVGNVLRILGEATTPDTNDKGTI